MINIKKFLFFFFILATMQVMTFCNNDSITDVKRIAGFYVATTFMEPGQHDAGIDILTNGGMLTARLSSDLEVEGRLIIPANVGSNFPSTDMNYSGTFTLDADTVRFKNTSIFLDNDQFKFIVKGTRLETPDWTGRWALFKIILEKQ